MTGCLLAGCLLAGCLLAGCSRDDDLLTARLIDNRLTLQIDGQCGPGSYLSRVRIATTEARVLWEVSRESPAQSTPTVTVGSVPAGFREETPAADVSGTIVVLVKTNFSYAATIDVDELGDGHEGQYTLDPVWNELSSVHQERC